MHGRAGRRRGEAEDVEGEASVGAEDDSLEDVDAGLGQGAGDGGEGASLVLEEQVKAQGLLARAVSVVLPVAAHARVRVVTQVLEQLQVHEAVLQHRADDVVGGQQRDELFHLLQDQGARGGELLLLHHSGLQRRGGRVPFGHCAARGGGGVRGREHAQRRGGGASRRAVHRRSRHPAQLLLLLLPLLLLLQHELLLHHLHLLRLKARRPCRRGSRHLRRPRRLQQQALACARIAQEHVASETLLRRDGAAYDGSICYERPE
eukprot:scaffold74161_cov45-Phaeocystis_antarctica.AAC.1